MLDKKVVEKVRKCHLAVCLLLALGLLWGVPGMTVCAAEEDSGAQTPGIVASGTCGLDGAPVTWELDADGVLTVGGSGAIDNFTTLTDLFTGEIVY